jgi:hypothetical protein
MLDGLHSPYHMQEHRSSARWLAGTPECATPLGVTARCTAARITGGGDFVIKPVVPESPTAHGSPVEEQQQPEDHDVEDKANEEYPPPSDAEGEKMYQDVDEWSPSGLKLRSPPAGFGLCWNTSASQPPPSTGSRKSCVLGRWSSKSL